MGELYRRLGLRVGCVQAGESADQRRDAYAADVTHLTAKEAGFDQLRDGLVYLARVRVQRPLHLALVDEADSILTDEARIPLVLAGSGGDDVPDGDYELDAFRRAVCLTEAGLARAEAALERLVIRDGAVDLQQPTLRGPASTWTYLVDDDPFRDALGLGVAGDLGLAIGAGLLWPLYLLAGVLRRWRAPAQKSNSPSE